MQRINNPFQETLQACRQKLLSEGFFHQALDELAEKIAENNHEDRENPIGGPTEEAEPAFSCFNGFVHIV